MRKIVLFIATFLMISFNGYSQKWNGITSDRPEAPKRVLVSSDEKKTVVDFYLSGYYSTEVNTPEGEKIVVTADDMYPMLNAGTPDVPMAFVPVLIGDRAEMSVRVANSEYVDIKNVEIAPSKGNFSRQINPDDVRYSYGEMYQQDAFFPSSQVSMETPYIIRDFRGQNIMVYPFAYNAVTKTLRVYTHLEIVMEKVSDNGVNAKSSRRSNVISMDPEVKDAYSRRFINFEEATAAKYNFLDDAGETIIICKDEYMDAMQPYMNWKNISGRPTTMVSTSVAGNTADAVKNYLSGVYAANPNLTFVLLVGEYDDITPKYLPYSDQGYSDNYMGMLEGDDYYLELLVGRFSVASVNDVTTHVNKVIYYERDMNNVNWVSTGLGVAANEGAGGGHMGGEADYVHMNYIRDTLLGYTYTDVKQQYKGVGAGTSASAISADVNAGTSIINYTNHGSETSWGVANYSVSHVNALTNDNKLPVVWSVACLNGKFNHSSPCFAEAWLRAKNSSTGNPTGAIGGMFSWISQPWVPPMTGQDEMVNILCGNINNTHKHTLGGTSLNGAMKILDAHPNDGGATQSTWILFGDPSLMMRTANPTSMNVSCTPSALMIGMSNLQVTANAEFAIATLSYDGEVIASANVVNGVAELTFPALSQVGDYDLVVIGYNKETYIGEVSVVPAEGPYVVFDSYDFDDANGQFDYGENIELKVSVNNVGVETANNVTLTLSTESEYINIVNNTLQLASINANQVLELDGVFTLDIAANVPDEENVTFVLSVTDGSDTWVSNFNAKLHSPVFELVDVILEPNSIQPGDSGVMSYSIVNKGTGAANDVTFELFSSSADITLTTNTVSFETIASGETVVAEIPFSVSESTAIGSTFEMMFAVNAGHYTMDGTYILNVGVIVEDFETGDFSKYDWQFSGTSWEISTDAFEGSYSATSGTVTNNSSASMKLTLNVVAAGEMSFNYKVSSEENYDKLIFYVDGVEKDNYSGEVGWTHVSYMIAAGEHEFEWKYKKDSSVSDGDDCAWIDNIEFPPTNVVAAITPVTNLVADVQGNTVTLTWDASAQAVEYAIYRDGEELAVQAETEYLDQVPAVGVYTYSVVARSVDGASSQPVHITVNVETVDIAEVEESMVSIYPNPSNGVIYIDGFNSMEVSVFNIQGQMVMNQTMSDEQNQIDMSNLTKGIYFIKLTNSNGVVVKKVVLE